MQHGPGRPLQQVGEPPHIRHARACILPRGFQQQMVGLIFPQHVINEICRKSDLPPRLALARMLPLDKAADDSNIAEGAFQQGTRSEEHTSELQSLMRISYAVFCLKKKKTNKTISI